MSIEMQHLIALDKFYAHILSKRPTSVSINEAHVVVGSNEFTRDKAYGLLKRLQDDGYIIDNPQDPILGTFVHNYLVVHPISLTTECLF